MVIEFKVRRWRRLACLMLWILPALGSLSACTSASMYPAHKVIRGAPLPAPAPASVPVPLPLNLPLPHIPPATVEAPVIAPPQPIRPPMTGDIALEPTAVESPGVAARFPDPDVTYQTPAFQPGHVGFTSNAESLRWLRSLASANTAVARLEPVGSSQAGVPLEALVLSRDATAPGALTARPTVLLVGQQHGDEPAGSEALLVIAQSLARGPLQSLLDRINVVILARANPDGAAAGQRLSASGIDINRDHLLLRTPEARAQAQLVREFNPAVVLDAHEYPATGPYLQKFGAVPGFDAMVQYAAVANLPEFITRASEEWFREPMVQRLKEAGLRTDWYHTISADPADRKLSMGGVQPDIGRNANGLTHAISLLVETRGVGLGQAHLKRRVHTHVVAITSVLNRTAQHAADLMKLRHFVDAEVSAKACQGDVVIDAELTPSEYSVLLLDPVSGADKPVTVTWDSALALVPTRLRARPCGYWLDSDQTDAVLHLRALGVQVHSIDEAAQLRGEIYRGSTRELVAIGRADSAGALNFGVTRVPALVDVNAGSYYVSLGQPLAHLVIAVLEPDTPYSFAAHRIVTGVQVVARVLERPEFQMTRVP